MESTSLISNVNGDALRQANLLTNRSDLITVLVEDEVDVAVWHRILKKVAPQFQYHVTPYSLDSTTNGKGKPNVLRFADRFNHNFIGCVDSDFDWLLEDWTQDGNIIKGNRFILQTYAYSIENLASQPYGDSDCMLNCVMHSCDLQRNLDREYSAFIRRISDGVYELLLWHLLMWKKHIDEEIIGEGWAYVFGNDHYKDILADNTLSIKGQQSAIADKFELRARERVDYYNGRYPGEITDREHMKNHLFCRYQLSPTNAYLYVRGHDLHEFLMHCFFKSVKDELIEDHKKDIIARNTSHEISNQLNHYKKSRMDFSKNHLRKVDYLDDPDNVLAKDIKNDISNALQG